jgi:mono/diheme cytochrome c family protein
VEEAVRARWLAAVAALLTVALQAAASRKPLLEQASAREANTPNPYQNQQGAGQAGHKIYERECSACHGAEAQGRGHAPALASPTIRKAPPGAIFWVLRNGSIYHGMPSFAHLPDAQRWQIVTYLKSLPTRDSGTARP